MTKYSVFWLLQKQGGAQVLAGHPGAFSESDADAVAQGQQVLANVKHEPVRPLAVVQTTEEDDEAIYTCEEVYLGGQDNEDLEEMFFDVTSLPNWQAAPWWPKG